MRLSEVTRLELGFSARSGNAGREAFGLPPLSLMPIEHLTPAMEDRAFEVPMQPADRGQHRAPSIPDLLVAATADPPVPRDTLRGREFGFVGGSLYILGMARSDEHDFVTKVFIDCAREMSRSQVFGYAEADRGMFDFACVLERDNSRNLIGQTLTHHAAGIDKDLASLLHDPDGNLPVYLYPHEARNEGRVREFLSNASSRLGDRVSLLRLFRYPVFDADKSSERVAVAEAIKSQIVDDLLLNVLFGRLAAEDIGILLNGTGMPGLLIAALDEIATLGFLNFPTLGRSLEVNPSTLRNRVSTLVAAGMLNQALDGAFFQATARARVFLQICHLLLSVEKVGPELAFILDRLGLGSHEGVESLPVMDLMTLPFGAVERRIRLVTELGEVRRVYGHERLAGGPFRLTEYPGLPPRPDIVWIGR